MTKKLIIIALVLVGLMLIGGGCSDKEEMIAEGNLVGDIPLGATVLYPQQGGTGIGTIPQAGQLLIGNDTNYTLSTLTGTANEIEITNAQGSITLGITEPLVVGYASVSTKFEVGSDKFTVIGASGNTDIVGILDVTGLTTLVNASISTKFEVGSDKFTVIGASGNTDIVGTLDTTGLFTFVNASGSGDFEMGTNKLRLYGATGNLTMSGTFNADTAASHSFTGDLTVGDDLYLTGDFMSDFDAITAASHSFTGDLDIGDDLTVTDDLTVSDDVFITDDLTVSGVINAFTLAGDIAAGNYDIAGLTHLGFVTASASGNVDIIGNLDVGGIITGLGVVASNGLDFDEWINSATLDADYVVASGGFQWRMNNNLIVQNDLSGKRLFASSSQQFNITAVSDQIPSNTSFVLISPDADYVMTSTPHIASGSVGQILIVENIGSFTIDFQDNANLSGSGIQHGGTDGIIEPSDVVTFIWQDAGGTGWHVQSHPNVQVGGNAESIDVRNTSGSTIVKGKPVYLTGFSVGQNRPTIALADADDPAKMPAIGITNAAIANNVNGTVVINGTISMLDTSDFSTDDILYASISAGNFTATRPTVNDIQPMAIVLRSNSTNGSLLVVGVGRDNVPASGSMETLNINQNLFGYNASLSGNLDLTGDIDVTGNWLTEFDVTLAASHSFQGDLSIGDDLVVTGDLSWGTMSTTIDMSTNANLTVGATGIELSDDDIVLTTNYYIPLIASASNWDSFYQAPSSVITAGASLSWSGNTLNYDGNHAAVTLAGTPNYLTLSGQAITLTKLDMNADTNLTVGATGIELSTNDIALTTNYYIPLIASASNWDGFYQTPSTVITAGTGLTWSTNTLNATAYTGGDFLTLTSFDFDVDVASVSDGDTTHLVTADDIYEWGTGTFLPLAGGTLTGGLFGTTASFSAILELSDNLLLSGDEKEIRFYNGSNYVGLKASTALAGDQIYSLPITDGGAGSYLKTNGAGSLTWDTPSGAGDVTNVGSCAGGICLDGTSDGGTDITFYNIDSNKTQLIASDTASDLVITLPATTGTLALTSVATLSSLTSIGTIGTGTWEATDVGVAHGGTGVSSWTQYLIPYADTTTSFSQIAIGSAGQVLTSQGAGAVAAFETLAIAAGEYAAASIDGDDVNSNIAGTNLTLTAGSPDTLDVDDPFTIGHIIITTASVSGNFDLSGIFVADVAASHSFAGDLTVGDIITATGGFLGALTGNATTATALVSNPGDCGADTWATTIAANGDLTCAAVTYAGITAMTSANLDSIISDNTGSGKLVFDTSPVFATSIEIPQDGTIDAAGEIGVNTASDSLNFYGTAERVLSPRKCFGLNETIVDSTVEWTFGFVEDAVTIDTVFVTASPSGSALSYQIKHGINDAGLVDLFSAVRSASSSAGEVTKITAGFNDATIGDSSKINFQITSESATLDDVFIKTCGYIDP